jgi:uncharacterized lipoprotein YmbA
LKARRFATILDRALAQEDLKAEMDHRLRKGIEKQLDKCAEGDLAALQAIADRLDGRPAQSVTVAGDAENPLQTVSRVIIDTKPVT